MTYSWALINTSLNCAGLLTWRNFSINTVQWPSCLINLTHVVLQLLIFTAVRNKYTSLNLTFVIYNSMNVPITTALAASHNVYMLNSIFILFNIFINFPWGLLFDSLFFFFKYVQFSNIWSISRYTFVIDFQFNSFIVLSVPLNNIALLHVPPAKSWCPPSSDPCHE